MIKRIKVIREGWVHNDGTDLMDKEFDAITCVCLASNTQNATIDIGDAYPLTLTNDDHVKSFEIVAENDAYSSANLKEELDLVSVQRDELAEECQDLSDKNDDLKNKLKNADDELSQMSKVENIEREIIKDGYCLVPAIALDKELAEQFSEEIIITPTELVAMCCSAQLEINRGDTSKKSLNVKLYKAMQPFAEEETDRMIESAKA